MFKQTEFPYHFKYLMTGITGPGIKEVYLPDPSGYEILFEKEQKWVRPEPSKQLAKAIKEYAIAVQDDPNYIHPMQTQINQWADQEWDRSERGVYFWNNGVLTYITGFHYWYMTAWNTYFGYPEYRETDKEICYFLLYCEEDPECFGAAFNTIRRYGKSALMGGWCSYRTTKNFNHYSGMQGETDLKIEAFYRMMIKNPFKKLPYYFTPTYNKRSTLASNIQFVNSEVVGNEVKIGVADYDNELGSVIEFRASGAGDYDQAVLHTYLCEEPGKCHTKGTKIRMFDGSIKNVEDVQINDQLRGDDNNPRLVVNTGGGFGRIYKITPNSKGEPWYVNEDHILSCKVSGGVRFSGFKRGDIFNITVRDYLRLSKTQKKHLMCYRSGVEYPHRIHDIDPYLLGLWLGDGSSIATEITNVDNEVSTWLHEHSKIKGYSFTKKKCKNRTQTYYIGNGLSSAFKNKNLFGNKHIPHDYMIDSRENRLKLLAGLIDTDGHRSTKSKARYYEITQKRKSLALQIQELALSLGFYASFYAKKAKMNRNDGTVYTCEVYRVSIYGRDLHHLPCQVERKKMPSDFSVWNVKDPSVYGFTVQYDRDDYYYGFNITGNRLYLLSDYTVTHNTLRCNITDRWKTVKPCLSRGKYIRGKAFFGTTCEFMDSASKGGRAYKKLFYESDFDNKQANGRTISGLYAAFLPGDCAYEGFFDEWGHPMREQAKRSLLLDREAVKNNQKDLSDLIRKYPLTIKEIFWINSDRCEFNAAILQERKSLIEMMTEPIISKGEFKWRNNKRFGEVDFHHNPVTGWAWVHSLIEKPEDRNLVNKSHARDEFKFSPKNDAKFIAGVDPIDHGVVIEDKKGDEEFISTRRSKPVLLIKRKYDVSIDGLLDQEILEQRAKDKFPYKTNRYIAMMDIRPGDPNVFYERVLMMLWYFGCSIHVESQKPGVMNYLRDNGCEDFILNKYIADGGYRKNTLMDGTPASQMITQEYTGKISTYVEYFGHTIPFVDLIEDLLIFNPKKTTENDYSVAMGFTELGEKVQPKTRVMEVMDIHSFMPGLDAFGNVVE